MSKYEINFYKIIITKSKGNTAKCSKILSKIQWPKHYSQFKPEPQVIFNNCKLIRHCKSVVWTVHLEYLVAILGFHLGLGFLMGSFWLILFWTLDTLSATFFKGKSPRVPHNTASLRNLNFCTHSARLLRKLNHVLLWILSNDTGLWQCSLCAE